MLLLTKTLNVIFRFNLSVHYELVTKHYVKENMCIFKMRVDKQITQRKINCCIICNLLLLKQGHVINILERLHLSI